MCVGGGEVGSKSSRKSRRHRKQSGTRPLWASWGGWGTPLQDPLPAPTTTLRLQPPSEGRPLVSWEISKTGTPWNPCLTHHFHRFPQQVKESLDHLPLAETFFFFFLLTEPLPTPTTLNLERILLPPHSYRYNDESFCSTLPSPPLSPKGYQGCSLTMGGGRGQREQECRSQGTWPGPDTDSQSQDLGCGRKGKSQFEALIRLVSSSGPSCGTPPQDDWRKGSQG